MKKTIGFLILGFFASCGSTQTFDLIVNVTGQGAVESNPILTNDVTYTINVGVEGDTGDPLTDATAKVEKDGTVTLTASANDGSAFVEWESDLEDFPCTTGITCSFIVTDNVSVSATFAP